MSIQSIFLAVRIPRCRGVHKKNISLYRRPLLFSFDFHTAFFPIPHWISPNPTLLFGISTVRNLFSTIGNKFATVKKEISIVGKYFLTVRK